MLYQTLPSTLSRPVGTVVRQLGVPCVVRRPRELDTAADNSLVERPEPIAGPHTVPVVITSLNAAERQRVWGDRVEGDLTGLAMIDAGIRVGDWIIPQYGSARGCWHRVTGSQVIDLGGVQMMALNREDAPEGC